MDNKKKLSTEQLEILLSEIEKDPSLFNGRHHSPSTRIDHRQRWTDIAVKLNSADNGATKSTRKWQQAWRDWKSNTRKKAAKILNDRTDGKLSELSPLELKLLNLFDPERDDFRPSEIDIRNITEFDSLNSEDEESSDSVTEDHSKPIIYSPDMVTVYSVEDHTSEKQKSEQLSSINKRTQTTKSNKVKIKRSRIQILPTATESIRQQTTAIIEQLKTMEDSRRSAERHQSTLLETLVALMERNVKATERMVENFEGHTKNLGGY